LNKSLNEISFKEMKESPYFMLAGFVMLILLVVAALGYCVYSILGVKSDYVETRDSYKAHLEEIAALEELKAQSQKAEQQLSVYKEVLPDNLGDVYVLSENLEKTCQNFNLSVVEFQTPTETDAETKETVFTVSVKGSFTNIMSFMQYVSTLRQIHRVDSIALSVDEESVYTAKMTIVHLSQDGATGMIADAQ
jgi:Tfp pilus assembly protein PilO